MVMLLIAPASLAVEPRLECMQASVLVAHGLSCSMVSVKNTVVGCHALLQGIIQTRGLNPCLLHLSPALAGKFFTTSTTWEKIANTAVQF